MRISSCRVALKLKSDKLQFDDNSSKVEITSEYKSKKYFFDFLSHNEIDLENLNKLVDIEKLIDLRQSGFGFNENNQLLKSFVSLNKNVQLLAVPGSEGDLDLNSYPLSVFCSELFGGNCHTLCSFNIDADSIPEKDLADSLDFLSNIRKIRNRIFSVDSEAEDVIKQLDLELQKEKLLGHDLSLKADKLQKQLDDTQLLLSNSEENLEGVTQKMEELVLKSEQQIRSLNSEKEELESRLSSALQAQGDSLKESFRNQQEANLLKISNLELTISKNEKDRELETHLLRLNLSKAATSLAESKEESRILRAQNVLLKFELEDLKSSFTKFDQLHEQDLSSIVHHAEQVAKLKAAKAELEISNKLHESTISHVKLQLSQSKEECSSLMRQVLELQSQAIVSKELIQTVKQEGNLETRCSDLLRENELLAQNLQAQHNKVEELQKVVENGEADRESLIKLQVQLKLQQKLYSESEERVNSLSREILELSSENSTLKAQANYHQAHSLELKERLDQNIILLETLTNSTKSNFENTEYQKKFQEERKAQQEFVDKMLAREAAEREGLIQSAIAAAAEPSIKRSIADVGGVIDNAPVKKTVKRSSKSKTDKGASSGATEEEDSKETMPEKALDLKTNLKDLDISQEKEAAGSGDADSVRKTTKKKGKSAKEPILEPATEAAERECTEKTKKKGKGTSDISIAELGNSAVEMAAVKNDSAANAIESDEEMAPVKAAKKTKAAKKIVKSPDLSEEETLTKKAVTSKKAESGENKTSIGAETKKISLKQTKGINLASKEQPKENLIPSQGGPTLGSLFSQAKDAAKGPKSGLLSSFWKRSKPSITDINQEPAGDLEFPKIPKAYSEKRKLELLYGNNDSID